ncbi:hypothetical protein FRC06_008333 [Ceratobasidium sp. 370]|nr:hypothetical protein FRC06_008333 [Ceratobasidium sp. 370]
MNGWPGHGHLASPIPLTVRTAREHPDEWAERDELSARRAPQSASSGDDSPTSPRRFDEGADRPIGNGLLLSPDGRIVRHVDSFVRSTRHRGRGERADEPIDISDEEGSPRSRRLTFEFRNFNLYPDARDSEQTAAAPEKRRPSRSLDLYRVDDEPTYASYLPQMSYATTAPQQVPYYGYGVRHMPPLSPLLPPLPSIHARSPDPAGPMVAGPSLVQGSPPSYRSIHSMRPAGSSRSKSDVGLSQRPTFLNGEKRGASTRDTTRGDEDDEGSSELSEPEDADGPSKSGDSSVTSGPRQRRKPSRARKKKPYKSRRCDICNKTFTKECDVTRHRRTAHGEDEIEFKCHECGRLFNRKDALERHYKVYEGTPHVARRYQPKTFLGQNKK